MNGKLGLPLCLMAVFASTRWPGLLPDNFSAAYALVFCAAVFFPSRLSWMLPFGTLIVTDVLISILCYHTSVLSPYVLVNYAGYGAIYWLGRRFTRRSSWLGLTGGGVLGALVFYLITNTASWLQNPEYAKTVAGWIQALTIGTPGWPMTWEFFRNTMLSGGLFSGLFAGAMKMSEAADTSEEEAEDEAEANEEPAPQESKA